MVHFFKELQATDHFEISLPHALSTNERQLVTLFYQPLTGAEPISLYLLLWAEAEYAETKEMTHYYLMNTLSMSARQVFEARIALEAIGLLRTFRQDIGEQRKFIYELIRPLDAVSFFSDPLLSMFLYSKIGEQPYRKLRQRFLVKPSKEGYQEVTRSFIDVYKPVHTNVPQDLYDVKKETKQDYPFYLEQFDFALLQAGLSEQLVPSNALTVEARELIAKLAFLYQLTPLDMQKVVILSLNDDMRISAERLKKAAADYYKLTISKDAPRLVKTFAQQESPSSQPLTKEQELLHYLETTPPIQVLRDINKGKEPIPASVSLAEELMTTYGMPTGVVNVLLEYVMLSTDMKLPRKYVEQIADHWNRKNLKTAKEAMELARKERDKYAQWKSDSVAKQSAPSKQYSKKYTNTRNEKVPDWFYKRDEQQEESVTNEIDFEKERQKILQKLGKQEK